MTADQHAPKHAGSASDLDTRLLLPPPHDPVPGWGQSLSRGAAGIALLHITRARRGAASWKAAHSWVTAATRAPISMHPSTGLFHGAAAVAFILAYADHPAYADALAVLDAHIIEQTRYRVDAAHQRIDRAELPALAEYDLISGLTGLGCYLLHRFGHSRALRDVLDYLVRLTKPLRARQLDGALVPGWWSSHDHTDRPSPALPGGHANLGMAHGIAGPLALLATAQRRGVTVNGQPKQSTASADGWTTGGKDHPTARGGPNGSPSANIALTAPASRGRHGRAGATEPPASPEPSSSPPSPSTTPSVSRPPRTPC
ncbi:hypothetical protein Acsp04_66760 [Actinomadura sp. NBRC 104425]|nr:lanthionine synthetase LanC family protein [Actinomadura sp. NBRC 104425]GLZ16441.1 hypothetical protein Acsp04_66760 [Actinomadura sp. NBRC 104425]